MASSETHITPGQCKAARAFLDWSRDDLAGQAKVGVATVADFERGKRTPYARTLRDLREAFESAGVEFTNGDQPGVRMRDGE